VLFCVQVTLSDRALMPGDVVRRLVEGRDSQRGYVTYTYVHCHVHVLNRPAVICDIDTRDLQPLAVCTLLDKNIGVGDGGAGGQYSRKIFFGQLLCKIRAFFRQNHVKFGNFVNFSGKYYVKFGYFFYNFWA